MGCLDTTNLDLIDNLINPGVLARKGEEGLGKAFFLRRSPSLRSGRSLRRGLHAQTASMYSADILASRLESLFLTAKYAKSAKENGASHF